jgi:hypothetical protein
MENRLDWAVAAGDQWKKLYGFWAGCAVKATKIFILPAI